MLSSELTAYLQSKPTFVSDGATGTNLQKRGLPAGMAPEVWVLENPAAISQLHKDFITSGSDIILTCTFGGTSSRLKLAGLEDKVELINRSAVFLAKQAAENKSVLVAGSIGPTGEMMEPYGTMTAESAFSIFQQQAHTLLAAGVDLIVIETQFDLVEAEAAIRAVRSLTDIGLICSFSYDRGTRTMMGVKPTQVAATVNEMDLQAIGINCGKNLETNLDVLIELLPLSPLPIWFKPNAGTPMIDVLGNTQYNITPIEMGAQAHLWIKNGAKIIGGCCGTSPEHLKQIALAAGA